VPAADAGATLALPARVDAVAVAALWRDWAPRAAALAAIDFGAVQAIESSGVALVRALTARALAAGAAPPRLLALPPRYRQLCLAHRIPVGDTSA
jgi:ABC-type transporter Mla MlaB component